MKKAKPSNVASLQRQIKGLQETNALIQQGVANQASEIDKRLRETRGIMADMRQQISLLRGALHVIVEWQSPELDFEAHYGANAIRDHFRSVARTALRSGVRLVSPDVGT